ncbi:hypothetical protein HK096_003942, partial [Nowakowskiella sp. JEL0078]
MCSLALSLTFYRDILIGLVKYIFDSVIYVSSILRICESPQACVGFLLVVASHLNVQVQISALSLIRVLVALTPWFRFINAKLNRIIASIPAVQTQCHKYEGRHPMKIYMRS